MLFFFAGVVLIALGLYLGKRLLFRRETITVNVAPLDATQCYQAIGRHHGLPPVPPVRHP